MIILGVDPGTATTGYGVLQKNGQAIHALDYGVIRTPPGQSPPDRLKTIHQQMNRLFDEYSPSCLVTERLFFSKNQTTAFAVGRAIGVVLLSASLHNAPWHEYTPMQVKQAVVGYGAADKKQVQFMIQRILNLTTPPQPDDAADALAIAICHAHTLLPDNCPPDIF